PIASSWHVFILYYVISNGLYNPFSAADWIFWDHSEAVNRTKSIQSSISVNYSAPRSGIMFYKLRLRGFMAYFVSHHQISFDQLFWARGESIHIGRVTVAIA